MRPTEELGPLVTVHRHTLLYRVIAVIVALGLLLLCALGFVHGARIVSLACSAAVLAAVTRFIWQQSRERLQFHRDGICLASGTKQTSIPWADLAKADISFAYAGNPPGFFEAELTGRSGQRIVLRANWSNREYIDGILFWLAQSPIGTW